MKTGWIFYTSIITTSIFLLNPTTGNTSHDDGSVIERMYNKNIKPLKSDLDAPVANSVTKTSNGYVFTFSNSDTPAVIQDATIHDILDQGINGFLFRTYSNELPHIRVKELLVDPDNGN